MTKVVRVGNINIGGGRPFALIAGPCVIESQELCLEIAVMSVMFARSWGFRISSKHRSTRQTGHL